MKALAAVLLLLATAAHAGPQDIIVKFADPGSAQTARIQAGAQLARTFDFIAAELWTVEGDPLTVCEELRSMPGVVYAVPDRPVYVSTVPNDSIIANQWHHGQASDKDIDSYEAWDTWTGDTSFVVGVIDTGIRINLGPHNDLGANMWRNYGEVEGDGIDNDANGFVDDFQGWDFGSSGPPAQDNNPHDGNSHGTHVSGLIGAVGNNISGVSGVMWRCKLMPVKYTVGIESYGYTSAVVSALDYCRMMGVRIVNCSFGTVVDDPVMHDAFTAANNAGMLLVCAAGNEGRDLDCCPTSCGFYPAGWADANIISVGGSTIDDLRYGSTNYGINSVDLFAPALNVYSTLSNANGPHYGNKTGTSMATPLVAGTAGLIWSFRPNLTAAEVKQCILATAEPGFWFSGKCVTGGRLNVAAALAYAANFGAGGGGGPLETNSVRPVSGPLKDYDVQGRRVDPAARSGVTFRKPERGATKKRATVK